MDHSLGGPRKLVKRSLKKPHNILIFHTVVQSGGCLSFYGTIRQNNLAKIETQKEMDGRICKVSLFSTIFTTGYQIEMYP